MKMIMNPIGSIEESTRKKIIVGEVFMTHQCEGTSFGAYIKPSKKPFQQDKRKTSYCGSSKTIILPQLLAFSTKKPATDSFA